MTTEKRAINPNPEVSVLWERICICSSLIDAGIHPETAKMIADQGYSNAVFFWRNSKFAGDPSYRLRRWTIELLRQHSISANIDVGQDSIVSLLGRIAQPALTDESRLALLIFLMTPTSLQSPSVRACLPNKDWAQQFDLGVKVLNQGWHHFEEARLHSICGSLMFFYHYAGLIGGKSYRDFIRQIVGVVYYKHSSSVSVLALQAWMMFQRARQPARTLENSLRSENRELWNQDDIQYAVKYLQKCTRSYQNVLWLQAKIEECYMTASSWEKTDWPQLVRLYRRLEELEPKASVLVPYVESISMLNGPAAGLKMLESRTYASSDPSWLLLRGELLCKMGRPREGLCNFQRALHKAPESMRQNLLYRMASCQQEAKASFGS